MKYAVIGLLVLGVGLGAFAQVNPFAKEKIDWYVIVQQYRNQYNLPLRDLSQDPISLKDFLFLRMLGINSRALAELYNEITEVGPISTLERLTHIKYWQSISTIRRLMLVFQFADEQAFFHKHPNYLTESLPASDYVFSLIEWYKEGK